MKNGVVVGEETLARFDTTLQRWVGVPVDVSQANEQVVIEVYGTGLRNRSNVANVSVTLGDVLLTADTASAHASSPGLDQLTFVVPPSLSGRGEVNLVVSVDGQATNLVTVTIK